MPILRSLTLAAMACATMAAPGLPVAGITASASAATKPGTVPLTSSAVPFTSRLTPSGRVAPRTRISFQVWLRPRTAAAEQYAAAVSTPGSPLFHHYLPPSAYTTRFGPSRADAARVTAWLRSQGFTDVRPGAQRSYLRATGAAATIDKAFRVQLRLYPATARVNAGPYRLRANDRPVTLPASLASTVLGITGLDNAAPVSTLASTGSEPGTARSAPCSQYYGQHLATGLPRLYGRSAFPTQLCGYTARQLRTAYEASPAATGRGQTIAFVEIGLAAQMLRTLRVYAARSGLPAPSAQRYSQLPVPGDNGCGSRTDLAGPEEQLDVEAAYDMAPAAHELVVGSDFCNTGSFGSQGLFDAETFILNGTGGHPLASVVSNSWEGSDESGPDSDLRIEHAFLLRAAAEGVGMYFSSGDLSGIESPSDDPLATAVGGVTAGLGKTGQRLFETGWSTAQNLIIGGRWRVFGQLGAAGGGPSTLWNQPAYQAGAVPAALDSPPGDRSSPVRSAPDISADADFLTGMAVGLFTSHKHGPPTFGYQRVGGTSLAAPLVAGMVIAAQQGRQAPFGFLNPVLYRMRGTGAIRDVLPQNARTNSLFRGVACDAAACGQQLLTTFDDQSPKMIGYFDQVTLPGYDNMTGLGTPAGQRFITVLRSLEKQG